MSPTSPARRRPGHSRPLWLAGLVVLAALAATPASAAPDAGADGLLSDEVRSSSWAFAQAREPIREQPDPTAPIFAKLRLATEHGALAPYLVLRRRSDDDGRSWLQVRVPMRPNGRTGWVRETALGELRVTNTRLIVSLGRRRATLYEDGRRVWSARVGIGKAGTPTPRGRFFVRERLRLSRPDGPYGSFAFGTSAFSPGLSDWPGGGVVGIHGTNEPGLIPGRISHGCVRLRNRDIQGLRRLMGLGTPILIR